MPDIPCDMAMRSYVQPPGAFGVLLCTTWRYARCVLLLSALLATGCVHANQLDEPERIAATGQNTHEPLFSQTKNLARAVVYASRERAERHAQYQVVAQTNLEEQWKQRHLRSSTHEDHSDRLHDTEQTQFDSICTPFQDIPDDQLKAQLLQEMDGHRVLGYRQARDHMYGLERPFVDVNNGIIIDAYTARAVHPDGTRTPGHTNTEHSWPQSKGTKSGPQHSDLHHLFIVDQQANSRRQNFSFGETHCTASGRSRCRWIAPKVSSEEPSKLGLNEHGEPVFQVRETMRGNIARAQFYIATRYNMPIDNETEVVLRKWHAQDPPDVTEQARNQTIFMLQGNRNLFVDCPELVDRIADF